MDDEDRDRLLADELDRARRDGVADAGNLPFWMASPGARSAILLVHGFAATPWEMRPLAENLAGRGFASLAVRLPGHGTTPEDLATRRWQEWEETVLRGFDRLSSCFARVYVAGLSTGSLLLLALARQRRPAGMVLLSPYLRLRHHLAPFAGWLRYLKPYQQRPLEGAAATHYYHRRPLAGIDQINRLVRELRPGLRFIDPPVLAIHGEGDQVVDIDSGRLLVEELGSAIKVYERLGRETPHVLTSADNPQREAVFELIGTFLMELEAQPCPGETSA